MLHLCYHYLNEGEGPLEGAETIITSMYCAPLSLGYNEFYISRGVHARGKGIIYGVNLTASNYRINIGAGAILLDRVSRIDPTSIGIEIGTSGYLFYVNWPDGPDWAMGDSRPDNIESILVAEYDASGEDLTIDISNQEKVVPIVTQSVSGTFEASVDVGETAIYVIDHSDEIEFVVPGYFEVSATSGLTATIYRFGTETGTTFRIQVSNSDYYYGTGTVTFARTGLARTSI